MSRVRRAGAAALLPLLLLCAGAAPAGATTSARVALEDAFEDYSTVWPAVWSATVGTFIESVDDTVLAVYEEYVGDALSDVPVIGGALDTLAWGILSVAAAVYDFAAGFVVDLIGTVLGLAGGAVEVFASLFSWLRLGVTELKDAVIDKWDELFGAAGLAWQFVYDKIRDAVTAVVEWIVSPSLFVELGLQLNDARYGIAEATYAIGDFTNSLSFTTDTQLGCVSLLGQTVCVLEPFVQEEPPLGIGVLVALFVGFWVVWATIEGLAGFSRMTDSS